jgi:methylmalonyl-CoA/ethylmalonyl-CoA epimerase
MEQVFHDPLQKVRVAFLATRAQDPLIELVEPAGDDSPVLRFLQEHGGGLHHVCYEVADLEEQLVAFRSRGALIAKRPLPAVAFGGRRIAWVITSEKLLVELLEEAIRELSGKLHKGSSPAQAKAANFRLARTRCVRGQLRMAIH